MVDLDQLNQCGSVTLPLIQHTVIKRLSVSVFVSHGLRVRSTVSQTGIGTEKIRTNDTSVLEVLTKSHHRSTLFIPPLNHYAPIPVPKRSVIITHLPPPHPTSTPPPFSPSNSPPTEYGTYFPRDETGLVCLPTQLVRTL
jgi:hypothetical protein